jgi:hypothetical protein
LFSSDIETKLLRPAKKRRQAIFGTGNLKGANAGGAAGADRRFRAGEQRCGEAPADSNLNEKIQLPDPRPQAPLYSRKLTEPCRIEK